MPYKSSINLGLPNIPDIPEPKFLGEFIRIYNAVRNLSIALDAYTGMLPPVPADYVSVTPAQSILTQNGLRIYPKFGAAVTYGQVVNLYDVAGILTARLADASSSKCMHGWCSEVGGVTSGGYGQVTLGGVCTAISGLTPGVTYYISNTPGAVSSSAGTLVQKIGYALGASTLYITPDLI